MFDYHKTVSNHSSSIKKITSEVENKRALPKQISEEERKLISESRKFIIDSLNLTNNSIVCLIKRNEYIYALNQGLSLGIIINETYKLSHYLILIILIIKK
jgi:hypothetical protein